MEIIRNLLRALTCSHSKSASWKYLVCPITPMSLKVPSLNIVLGDLLGIEREKQQSTDAMSRDDLKQLNKNKNPKAAYRELSPEERTRETRGQYPVPTSPTTRPRVSQYRFADCSNSSTVVF